MTTANNSITVHAIGHVCSPFKEKFAIPRQPGLVSAAQGKVLLTGAENHADLVKSLSQFSHIWLLFVFHGTQKQGWKPLVRPPRLGGNATMGVLATRSTFRPNPIGMSVVKLESVEVSNQQVVLHISGFDLLDKTPIIDIKPYIPYSDSITDAQAGFAQTAPTASLSVSFSNKALQQIQAYQVALPQLALLIEQVLAQDPRPAYKRGKTDDKIYGMALYDVNVQWKLQGLTHAVVMNISPLADTKKAISIARS